MKKFSVKKSIALKTAFFMTIFVLILQLVTSVIWTETSGRLLEIARNDTIEMVQRNLYKQEASNMVQLGNTITFSVKMLQMNL